jgi:hypothetical protein
METGVHPTVKYKMILNVNSVLILTKRKVYVISQDISH